MIYKYIISSLCYYIANIKGYQQLKKKYLLFLLVPFSVEVFYYLPQLKRTIFNFVKTLPYIRPMLDKKVTKEVDKIKPLLLKDRYKGINKDSIITTLPKKGLEQEYITKALDKVDSENLWKISGAIYSNKEKYEDMIGHIYKKFSLLSPTHPNLWPQLNQIRSEVLSICCNLYKGSDKTCAVFTAGGTLSIIQALYVYKKWGYDKKNITKPNIIVPSTVHASFRKGCAILDIDMILVDVDLITNRAIPYEMKNQINGNTILIVGSAPSFPCGIIDPINELSVIAHKYNIGFHVDACLGGFQLPFLEQAGIKINEDISFRNPFITSISADLHKFGKTPKGASVLMFSNKELRDYLTYVDLQWEGGMYVTPGFPGSESGATIIASWAIMLMTGRDEYTQVTLNSIKLCSDIVNEIRKMKDVQVIGTPQLSTFAIKSNTLNIHLISNKMHEKGWELNSLPNGIHFCIGELQTLHANCKDTFITDLRDSICYVTMHPNEDPGEMAAIYCSTQQIPVYADSMLDKIGRLYMDIQTCNI